MEKTEHKVLEGTLQEITQKLQEQQPPAEPSVEPSVVTEPGDPPPAAEPAAEPEPAAQQFDKYGFINQTFSTDLKTDEDIDTWRSTITDKLSRYDDLQKQYEQAQNELKNYNPRKHFASDEDYIVNQLKIKYPDLAPGVMSRVLTTDVTTSDPVRLIADLELMHDPKREVFANEEQAYKYVCRKLGYDPDIPLAEQDDEVQVAVRAGAKEARGEFNKLKNEIEVPKTIDLIAQQEQREAEAKANYDKFKPLVERDLRSVPAGLEKIDITVKTKDGKDEVLLSYDMGDFKESKLVKDTIAEVLEYTARNAREWTPEIARKATAAVIADLRKEYLDANIGQILKAHRDKVYKDVMDEKFKKENNSRPLTPEVNNPAMTEEQKKLLSIKDKVKQELGLKGKKTYAP